MKRRTSARERGRRRCDRRAERASGACNLLAIPLAFARTLVWPLAKAQSFTVEPSLAGASQAVSTLTPLLPLALLVTWVADGIGLGAAMAGTAALGAGAMALLLKRS